MIALESYNEFLREKIEQMFNKEEAVKFAEDSERQRPTVIRVNTLLKRAKDVATLLTARGVELHKLEWCENAFVVYKSQVPIGATPEYLAGYYTIQGASSLLPVIALDVRPSHAVLDMCAAPGGKCSFIANYLRNTGTLFSVDINAERVKALKSNLQRQNVMSISICMDARKLELPNMDRILLDAPCLGTGVVSKDPSVKMCKSADELKKVTCLQKELIAKAWSMLKVEGILVYSTCSILVEENEEVVDYLMKKFNNVKILDGPVVGKKGFSKYRGKIFHVDMNKCRRIYPHVHNMDGFFIAKLMKKHK